MTKSIQVTFTVEGCVTCGGTGSLSVLPVEPDNVRLTCLGCNETYDMSVPDFLELIKGVDYDVRTAIAAVLGVEEIQ